MYSAPNLGQKGIFMKRGFTLAEVLITLGIIGVVSAMTIPTLIQSYKNRIVETRLQKVYSVMNQAIQRAEAEYGAKELWDFSDVNFYDKYFAPYLKVLKTEIVHSNVDYRLIYFPDGSILAGKASLRANADGTFTNLGLNKDYMYYPNGKNYTLESLNETKKENTGVTLFPFRFAPISEFDNKGIKSYHYHKGFTPYAHNWDGTSLTDNKRASYSCKKSSKVTPNFCTMYIMQNGWKIPKDYPFKVK